jgi:hypothetical protein
MKEDVKSFKFRKEPKETKPADDLRPTRSRGRGLKKGEKLRSSSL